MFAVFVMDSNGRYLRRGRKAVESAWLRRSSSLQASTFTPRNLTRSLIAQLRRRNCPLFETTPEALATVAIRSPLRIILLARRPQHTLGDDATLLAGLEEVQDRAILERLFERQRPRERAQ
jgi:hypothetical protein